MTANNVAEVGELSRLGEHYANGIEGDQNVARCTQVPEKMLSKLAENTYCYNTSRGKSPK